MKLKKIKLMRVTVEVEYTKPILGRLLAVLTFLTLIRFQKFTLKKNGKIIDSFYYLIIPRFVKGGGTLEK